MGEATRVRPAPVNPTSMGETTRVRVLGRSAAICPSPPARRAPPSLPRRLPLRSRCLREVLLVRASAEWKVGGGE